MESSPQSPRESTMRARISSFNDELKDTNRLVEMAHTERDNLKLEINGYASQIDGLKPEIETLKRETNRLRLTIEEESVRHKEVLQQHTEEEAILKDLSGDLNSIIANIDKETSVLNVLKSKSLLLNRQVKGAEEIINIFSRDIKKLESAVNKKNLELNGLELKKEQVSQETEAIRRKLKEEEKVFFGRVKRLEQSEQKHIQELQRFSIEQEKKDRDIRIVTARLKKKWSELCKDQPFPKI